MYLFLKPVPRSDREVVARLRNCVQLLAAHKMQLYDTSVLYTYEASLNFQVCFFKTIYNITKITSCKVE